MPASPVPPLRLDLPPAPRGLARLWRLAVLAVLGFASGLPLALTGQAMQAWLTVEGVDLATIGFLSLVGLPYTFKFLWAPLMDRFELPWLGRRRGWLVLTQLALAGALVWMAATGPAASTWAFALLALLVALLSASQDVVIDAYSADVLPAAERGLGSSLKVLGYRLAMILSGGVALIWTDGAQGGGWSWPEVYRLMALIMVGAAVLSAVALPRLPDVPRPDGIARNDLIGFVAVVAAAAAGVLLTDQLLNPLAHALVEVLAAGTPADPAAQALRGKWADVLGLLLGMAVTLPLAAWAARAARFDTLLGGLRDYFGQPGAWAFLAFIVLYKLGDAFAGSLMTPFLLKAMAFSSAEVGLVNKIIGLWLTLAGALVGGLLMLRLGLWRALVLFGLLQMASNLGFWWLAVNGAGALPGLEIPAFDWGLVRLASATRVDGGLLMVVAGENLSGGMGTAAFVAFLMSLTSQRYTATQYALLSAFSAIGRVWVGPMAGVLVESIGWPDFFLLSTAAALPALWLLWRLRQPLLALETPAAGTPADD
ncbi:PAT family beta-lactamase induction signal transducer AmpG [Sphaerotilus hippei]|uniref:PAT family beta-lactamase induction signal transducer AmpG n=1 Tax=Sphaerotilus hippei TaxID=744406 RepID=A0A318GWY5_9BURK|nr:MFS transporter [Sphaerotilus hippei]PXW93898.1 PAT family beta-lactamase induction signal transducer AmpG [Sphaerotilus hippei]